MAEWLRGESDGRKRGSGRAKRMQQFPRLGFTPVALASPEDVSETNREGKNTTGAKSSRSIPSLDGLRAASVALVLLAHSLDRLPGATGRYISTQFNWVGLSGVDVFFVISGFLITGLLLKELDATGGISLRNFYFRRFFRIFPPFYLYLAAVAALWGAGIIMQDLPSFIAAGTYTFNYFPHIPSWFVAHSWSLSLEEQFYLLWPPVLVLLGRRKATYAAIGVIVLSPVSRLATYLWVPPLRTVEWMTLHTRLDTIMFGCVVALLWKEIRSSRWVEKLLHPALVAFAVFYIAVVSPVLTVQVGGAYDWPVGYTLRALLVAVVLVYCVTKPESPAGRVLNVVPVRHIGEISYSLYLWQQIFTGLHRIPMPLNLLLAFACAELSYRVVERPSMKLRDRVAAKLNLSTKKVVQLASQHGKRQVTEESSLELVGSGK
jgi:peptidoglycan/LPS O-acetylase OafA/YrhL